VLDNAFKWARTRIRVGAASAQDRLRLEVEDDGPGISADAVTHVLERGTRVDQSVPGHGIGLAVTRDIVEAYDGRVEIGRSELGGARVTLTLPGLRQTGA